MMIIRRADMVDMKGFSGTFWNSMSKDKSEAAYFVS
jgi:hypothetical protein